MILKLKKLEFKAEDKGEDKDEDKDGDKVDVKFVDEKFKLTQEFRNLFAAMIPVLRHDGNVFQDADVIASHLGEQPGPPLDTHDVEANALGSQATPMSSLAGWIKNKNANDEAKMIKKFHKTLGDIDHTLGKKFAEFGGPFICGPHLKFPDCILLPKLYHAKVAALYTKGYDFTKSDPRDRGDDKPEFRNIASYLKAALGNSAFKETCPSEEEIQEKWKIYRKEFNQKVPRK